MLFIRNTTERKKKDMDRMQVRDGQLDVISFLVVLNSYNLLIHNISSLMLGLVPLVKL